MMAGDDRYASRSLTGHWLTGDRLVRFAYLDEAGISNPKHEPFFVVAGVLVQMDAQYRAIEAQVRALVDRHGPKHDYILGENYSFQAKELWHGTGAFPRASFSREVRISILSELVGIIVDYKLPVIFGYANRSSTRDELNLFTSQRAHEEPTRKQILNHELGVSYFRCFKRIEAYMRSNAADELCSVVFENNDETRTRICQLQQSLVLNVDRKGSFDETRYFQSNHIVEAPMFSDKKQSPIIQLADIAAFVLKRHLQKCEHIRPIFERLSAMISYKTIGGDKVSAARQPDALLIMDTIAQNRRYDAEE